MDAGGESTIDKGFPGNIRPIRGGMEEDSGIVGRSKSLRIQTIKEVGMGERKIVQISPYGDSGSFYALDSMGKVWDVIWSSRTGDFHWTELDLPKELSGK